MTSAEGQRIQSYCRIIWGEGDYDIDEQTDDWETYYAVVRRDLGTEFGPPLAITGICYSSQQGWKELDRMLGAWARQTQTGQVMTKEQALDIFSGPKGQSRRVLEHLLVEMEKRGIKRA